MKKIPIYKTDLNLYYEKLNNGLEIYVVPKEDCNSIYVNYTAKYGSIDCDFIPVGKDEMITVPAGIAHFLEHKVFEQKDGIDPFQFYSERGTSTNANTSNIRTTYLFSGTDFFEENLEFLQNFVESPYFTDENVLKEKGIIEQEIKMYLDMPDAKLDRGIMRNTIVKHPKYIDIAGTVESIRTITKEDLYTCYNTFYHPSNMLITVTGNVNPNHVINLITNHQNKRKINQTTSIVRKDYQEPDNVYKKHDEAKAKISVPQLALSYKINVEKLNDIPTNELLKYVSLAFSTRIDSTSLFGEKLVTDGLVTTSLKSYTEMLDNKHLLVFIVGTSENPKEVIKRLQNELKDIHISEEDFNRRKKSLISNWIKATDNIYALNEHIFNSVVKYGKPNIHERETLESMNIDALNRIIDNINLDNSSTYIVYPEAR